MHLKGAEKRGAEILSSYNLRPSKVLIHWYSGPPEISLDFAERGFFFSINPSILSGSPHMEVLYKVPISQILTESDGNVKYTIDNERIIGSPGIIPRVIRKISEITKKNIEELSKILSTNFQNYLK